MLVSTLLRSNTNIVCQVDWLSAWLVVNMFLGIDGCHEHYTGKMKQEGIAELMQHQTKALPFKRHPRLKIPFKRNTNELAGPEISYTNVTTMLDFFCRLQRKWNPRGQDSMQNVLQVVRQPKAPLANPASSTQPAPTHPRNTSQQATQS